MLTTTLEVGALAAFEVSGWVIELGLLLTTTLEVGALAAERVHHLLQQ